LRTSGSGVPEDLRSAYINATRGGKGNLDDSMVSLRKYLVGRAGLTNRARGIPPYFRVIKQLKKPIDER
jgi:hypothetical protein